MSYFSIMEIPSKGILHYIPIFYVIWSDDLLSASEVSVVAKNISGDGSLTPVETERLLGWLDRDHPPKDKTIREWKELISTSGIKLVESDPYPLSSFSQRLAGHYHASTYPDAPLQQIEINLGIQPNHYHHLFEVEVIHERVSSYYSGVEINQMVLGDLEPPIQELKKKLSEPLFSWDIRRLKDDHRERVLEQLLDLAGNGYGALAYSATYGGTNDFPFYAAVFEHLIWTDASLAVKFGVQFGLFGGSIQKLGTRKHHDLYLKNIGAGDLLGCFAMTETMHGSNVRGIKTTATYDHGSDLITIDTPGKNDNKEYIGNAMHAKMATVFAQLIVEGINHGVHGILVPIRDSKDQLLPGVTIEDNGYKFGLNGVDNGKIWFRQVSVPRVNLLDEYGNITEDGKYQSPISDDNKRFFTMLGTLVGGRICVAKGALGAAKQALAIAVNYALNRRQFNEASRIQEDLIMDYPSHQLRLTPPLAQSYVYQIALDRLVAQYSEDKQTNRRKLETQVAGIKALVTWFARDTVQECREACGGKGYLLENRIPGIIADVDIFTTFEGDNTVLLQLAGKGILSDFRDEFNSDDFAAVLRLLGTQLGSRLSAINPLYTNKVDSEHLYNPKFHLHALGYRTRRLTYTLALRLRDYIKKGMSAHQAFLKIQSHLLVLGKAYSIELSYGYYLDYTSGISEEKYRLLFLKMGALSALYEIHKDAGWFLEQGYISSRKSKAIRNRVERLCSELRPHISALAEGYGIPENCLDIPIYKNPEKNGQNS